MAKYCYIYIMNFVIGDRFKDTKILDKVYTKPPYATKDLPTGIIPNSDIVEITNITSNSVEVLHLARTNMGVNALQWYGVAEGPALKDFENRFKKI